MKFAQLYCICLSFRRLHREAGCFSPGRIFQLVVYQKTVALLQKPMLLVVDPSGFALNGGLKTQPWAVRGHHL